MSHLFNRIKTFFASRGTNTSTADAHFFFDQRLVHKLSGKKIPTTKQLKHLPRFLSASERQAIHILLIVIAVCVGAILLKFGSAHLGQAPAAGGEYVEASVGNPHNINPLFAATNDADLDIVKLVFSGLMKTDAAGKLMPDLASSYQVSDDGKTYTFHLRNNVKWHDGADLEAQDVVATVQHIKDPAWKSPLAAQFKNVSVAASDDLTVTLTLAEPFAPFLSMLTFGILPEHLWQEVKPENAARAELNIKPVGTGPFKFKSFAKDKKGVIVTYTLSRNDRYYAGKPHLESIGFRFYPDFGSAEEAFLKRQVDGVSFLPLEYRDDVEKVSSFKTYTLRLPQYTALFFNTKNTLLKTKELRTALALAIDRVSILKEAVGENGVPVNGPILSGFVGYASDVKHPTYNKEAAESMLEKLGWKLDADGIRKKTTVDGKKKSVLTPIELTLTTVDAKENVAAAQAIKKNWEAVGVKTSLEIVAGSKIQKDKIRPREYDALLYGEITGPDPDPFPFWHSSQNDASGFNLSVYSNRRVDELLEKARTALKPEQRETMYKEFQNILGDDVPALFFYSPTYTYAVNRKVQGIDTATIFSPADRFNDVKNWYIHTRPVWKYVRESPPL